MLNETGLLAASAAVSKEWQAMVAEMSPHMSPGDIAKAFVAPGNHRLLRAAITAYLDNRPSEQVAHPPRISDEAVERVARAICESDYNVWEDSSPRMQSAYLMNARAALAALADGRE